MSIKIPRHLLAELFAHAFEDDPNECCGLLFGTGDEADEVHRMTNVNSMPVTKYTMQSGELVQAQEIVRKSNRELVAIYHSHTVKDASPSATDISNANGVAQISTRHVIISLIEKTRPVVRAFSINGSSEMIELIVETESQSDRSV